MVRAKNVVKKFGDFAAVDGVDLHIQRGECFGLLGPNGAGKSTFINMIYGAALRTSGELQVLGLDPSHDGRKIKQRLGVVTQDNALDESLTVRENMMIYAAFAGVPAQQRASRVDRLLEFMNLEHKGSGSIRALSGGMKRRLVFVRALIGEPEFVILDEPTTGLDPAVRHLLWGKVRELREKGVTVLITTHYMHEAEILCDRVAVMSKGKVLDIATPKNLIATHTPGFVGVFAQNPKGELAVRENAKGAHVHGDASGIFVRTPSMADLLQLQQKVSLELLQMRPANLEDVFLKMTGQELTAND